MSFNLFKRDRAPLAKLAECPGCQCEVSVEVLVAYRHAGEQRERAGVVCECVRCGARYTVLDAGGAISYGRRQAVVPQAGQVARVPGGEGTEGGGSLFGDMVTNLDGREF